MRAVLRQREATETKRETRGNTVCISSGERKVSGGYIAAKPISPRSGEPRGEGIPISPLPLIPHP